MDAKALPYRSRVKLNVLYTCCQSSTMEVTAMILWEYSKDIVVLAVFTADQIWHAVI